ncbi:MAG TPA: hypothetical protein VF023_10970, partial [Bryobacteraceae bacterium]
MKRFLFAALAVVIAGLLGYSLYYGNRRLKAMDARIGELSAQVTEATQLAKEESVAASAAVGRATEAAARAEIAAGARAQAEQQRDQAQAGQAQAET